MTDADLQKLLRYLSGELRPEDEAEMRTRLEREPELRAQMQAWQEVRGARPPAWDTESALASLRRELKHGEAGQEPTRELRLVPRQAPRRSWVARYGVGIAAALLLAAGVSVMWSTGRDGARDSVAALSQEYSAPRGRRVAFRLPDSSQVMLSAESRLRVASDFGRPGVSREVWLEGEGYFEVTHDESRPFIVRTATSVTEDLGTVFTVRAYPEEAEVRVVVAEGEVAFGSVHDRGRPEVRQVLTPGQLGRIDTTGALQVEHDVALDNYLAWTKGVLAFHRVPFRQAARDVARWYDLEIEFPDPSLGSRRLSGTFGSEPSDSVLTALANVLDATYERQGRLVTFSPRSRVR